MTKKEHECVESQRWVEDRVSGFIPSCLHLVSPLCESIKLFVLPPLGEKGLIGGKDKQHCLSSSSVLSPGP